MSLSANLVFRLPGACLIFLVVCWPALASEIPIVKPPVTLEAAKFVPGELMKGKVYHVRPDAVNDGYVTTYTLETEWGELKAVSDYRLRARIQEAKALKTLDEMSRAGVFGDALVEGALAPIDAVVDLVTDPVDTVSDAAEGMGQWFGNVANALTSDDPHQEGAVSAAVGSRYMQQRAQMMAKFHEEISPTSFVPLKQAPLQRTQDGRVIGLFPLDYVPWTSDLDVIIGTMSENVDQMSDVTSKELWFEGVVSPETRKGLEAHGWVVKENVQLLITAF
jgi:hypothetical protein